LRAALFPLGRIVATPGALKALRIADIDPVELLARHCSGDWGDLDAHDLQENDRSVRRGWRILSAYETSTGGVSRRVWIVTEGDRSSTCLLLPEEY
jgi:hypothetical protein